MTNKEENAYQLQPAQQQSDVALEMISALIVDYLNVYVADINTDRGSTVKLEGYTVDGIKNSPNDFCYSEMVTVYANTRVFPEDKDALLKEMLPEAITRTFADGKKKYELTYRVAIGDKLEHYSVLFIRISEPGEPLRLIVGFRNTEEVVSVQKKSRAKGLYDAYSTISNVYFSMFRINIKKDTFTVVKATKEIQEQLLTTTDCYSKNEEQVVKALATEESYQSARDFLNLGTLEERMQDKKHISTYFDSACSGLCRLHFIREDVANDGGLLHVILAVELLDEGKYQSVFEVFARNYQNVLLINLSQDTAQVLKQDGTVPENMMRENRELLPYSQVMKHFVLKCVHPGDKDMLMEKVSIEKLREVFATQTEYSGNYRVLLNDQVHYCQYNYNRIDDEDYLVAGFQNIDAIIEEHLAEDKKQREKEEAHRRELKQQFDIVDSLTSNFRTVYLASLNSGLAKILRLSSDFTVEEVVEKRKKEFPFEEVVKAWASVFVHPEDSERVIASLSLENLKKVFATQDEYVGTYRSTDERNPENREYHNYQFVVKKVDTQGTIICGFQIIDAIIKEHVEQEKARRELEEAHLRGAREHAEVISSLSTIYSTIFRADIDTHHYDVLTSVSLMGEVAGTGGNFDDVKESILSAFMVEEMRPAMSDFLDLNTLADRLADTNTVSQEYKNPAGRWFQARFIVKKRNEEGVAKEVLYVARDCTTEKVKELEQQEQLANALAAAQQASKAKSTFLNSMSHDIRTPMNAIIGFTALAQTHINDQAQVQDYLSKISTSSTHLLSLINDILDMSRIESGTVKLDEKPIHLPDLLHDLRTMIQGLIGARNQNLYIDTQDVEHEDVVADKLRLNQVLLNIVGNAIKFTQPGGDIIISLIEKPCRKKHYASFILSVKDNGMGMSPDFVDHIFDTFSRERSATVSGIQGTGLGMAITKNIVEMMGGKIEVESIEGKGSKFTVTLSLRLAKEHVENEPIPELLGARALIVDDDLNTCRSVSKMLRDIQMRPDWCASGTEAVVRAQDAAEANDEYKAYIIDYLMPDMNGIEAVRRIRRVINEEVPIIVLTAYDWADFEEEARAAGVTAFVSKPIFMSELREVLTQPVVSEHEHEEESKEKRYDYTGKHILLVEDNELNRELAVAILEETGMTIDSVDDGDVAVEAIDNAPADKYDLVLMDIQMPKMDGYTATREIRTLPDNRKANIPIVAMTANAFEEDRQKAFAAGMNGHIIKPISIDEIAEVLDVIF